MPWLRMGQDNVDLYKDYLHLEVSDEELKPDAGMKAVTRPREKVSSAGTPAW